MNLLGTCKPLIGVVHLPPLPGSPGYKRRKYPPQLGRRWDFSEILEYAVEEAKKYERAGFNAIIIENYGDKPYGAHAGLGETAAIAIIAREVSRHVSLPIGVSLLRNSGYESVYAALVSGASFVRVNDLCEIRASPEGLLFPEARRIARALTELNLYDRLEEGELGVMADISVKHSWPVIQADISIGELVEECLDRTGFPLEAIVISGPRTGVPPSLEDLQEARRVAARKDVAVVVGSGLTPENLPSFWKAADGFIVGTWVKLGRITENMVSVEAARRLSEIAQRYRQVWPCQES
ncbi:MAG: BtpA/SgcQ family protein [Desulfurococcales archaeon]|nr:BtpA/SgcQ family protein [Desulfurococcales archaeon]